MFTIILLAFVLDLLIGEPAFIPHPVVLAGKLIERLDRGLNNVPYQQAKGVFTVLILLFVALAIGWLLQEFLLALPLGGFWLALAISLLIASRSLYEHVLAVKKGLLQGLDEGRMQVAKICGRDPENLDEAGIARGAIESLAESFCDGILAPLFWACLFGLPGILAYKLINTADSMIGHKDARYNNFGWAAARLDDLMNFIPARLSVFFILIAAGRPAFRWHLEWREISREAAKHQSPNAGWPEAAMARALDLALGGPRFYGGSQTDDEWLNEPGRKEATSDDISRALRIFRQALAYIAFFLALAAFISH